MPAHSSIARAAALMSYERVHRVVVLSPSRAVVGIVSAMDVLRWLARNDGYAATSWALVLGAVIAESVLARPSTCVKRFALH